jgi:serine/threonine-protein kinase
MAVTIGTQLGSYEITALLGKGGMGEVYRARDSKLKRDVAIKLLPEEFSRDPDRASRFQREAEVLAVLNHPNIAAIYDLEETNDTRFLVLELVEGETLADRIQRGAIPVDEALQIAHSICEALEAAHERGIIHRDLKPANVKITPAGKVKVLDFGLAKAMENAPTAASLSNSPTMISGAAGGIILGTAAYMSPEQARGRTADQRSDVFAFGCVLFEMLTGRQAFQGGEVSDILASVLKTEPDWNALPQDLNRRVRHVLRRALEKDPRRRWYAIGDVRVELEMSSPAEAAAAEPSWLWKHAIGALIAALLVGIAAAAVTWNLKPSAPAAAAVTRFSLVFAEDPQFTTIRQNLAISPDGSHLVYAANRQLYLRSMNETEVRPLPGTGDTYPTTPFFSPDGQWIGFEAIYDRSLKKISITGGVPIPICKVSALSGATWVGDRIVFGDIQKGILRVSDNGGEPEVLVSIKPEEGTPYGPQIIGDGKTVLFTLAPVTSAGRERWDRADIVVQRLQSREPRKTVIRGGSDARYLSSGHIVYALGDKLFAIPFDAQKLETRGVPVSVIDGIQRAAGPVPGPAAASVAFAANGTAAYIPSGPGITNRRALALVDDAGKADVLPIPVGAYRAPRISPDGTQLAFEANQQVWLYDLSRRGQPRPLTFTGRNLAPIWDGRSLIFQSDRETEIALYRQAADGTGVPERLEALTKSAEPGATYVPFSVSPASRILAFLRFRGESTGVSFLSLSGDQNVPQQLPDAPSANAAFSYDGRWVAYAYRIGQQPRIFVRPYPSLNAQYQITGDGNFPVWSPDRKKMYYVRFPNKFVAVEIQTEPAFSSGMETDLPITNTIHDFSGPRNYDITPNGKQFVVVLPASPEEANRQTTAQINVILNWIEELKQRVPVK